MEGQEVVEEEGEEVVLLQMREEEAAEVAPRGWRRGPVEVGAGGSLGWAEEAAGRTCPVGMEGEEGVQRRVLWRGEEAAGRLDPWREEGEEGLSRGGGVGEEGRLWMEEVEELERQKVVIKKEQSCNRHHSELTLQT